MDRVKKWLAPLFWLGGWGYLAGLLGALFFLLFIESLPYIYLVALPIPVLAPVVLLERLYGWRFYGILYLILSALGIIALLAGRIWLDLWYPMDI